MIATLLNNAFLGPIHLTLLERQRNRFFAFFGRFFAEAAEDGDDLVVPFSCFFVVGVDL